jgi:hypothetical protein
MKIGIIGGGSSNRSVPWDDASWQWWGFNALHKVMKRPPSLWFEIHERGTAGVEDWEIKLLKRRLTCPVMMAERHPDIPFSVKYPPTLSYSGPMTSSFCYALALAIEYRPESIGLWGVDLDGSARELTVERFGLWYWIGVAKGKGIAVSGTSLGMDYPFRYGIDYWDEVKWARQYLGRVRKEITSKHVDDVPVHAARTAHID